MPLNDFITQNKQKINDFLEAISVCYDHLCNFLKELPANYSYTSKAKEGNSQAEQHMIKLTTSNYKETLRDLAVITRFTDLSMSAIQKEFEK